MSEELLKDLSEESLTKIKEAIEVKVKEKVSIHVEKALTEQDELYSSKLEQLLKAIDTDHSKKLEKVVEAIDTDRAEKLKMVVEKYEQALNNDAASFKAQLVESISDYLESFLEEKIPTADIQEAVRNKKAISTYLILLSKVRVLAVVLLIVLQSRSRPLYFHLKLLPLRYQAYHSSSC